MNEWLVDATVIIPTFNRIDALLETSTPLREWTIPLIAGRQLLLMMAPLTIQVLSWSNGLREPERLSATCANQMPSGGRAKSGPQKLRAILNLY